VAELERAAALEILTFQEDRAAGERVQRLRRDHRRGVGHAAQALARGHDVVECYGRRLSHAGFSLSSLLDG
jgi:hypothetical protein